MDNREMGCFWVMLILSIAFILYIGSVVLEGISNLPTEFWKFIGASCVIVFFIYIFSGNSNIDTPQTPPKSQPQITVSKPVSPKIAENDDDLIKTIRLIVFIILAMAIIYLLIFSKYSFSLTIH